MSKKNITVGILFFLVAMLSAGLAGYATAKGTFSKAPAPTTAGPAQKVQDVRNAALMSLSKVDDIGAEVIRRSGDREFMDELLTGVYSMQDLIDLGKRKDEVHATIRRDDIDDKVKIRLAQLTIVGFPFLLGTKEHWSNAYRAIYAVNRKFNVAMLTGITEEYTIVVQKYAPLTFEDAFAGWGLSETEAGIARKQFESAVKEFSSAPKR